jgi:hypothetical protein
MAQKLSRNFQEKKDFKVPYIVDSQEEHIPEIEEKQIDDEIFIKKALQSNPKYGCELLNTISELLKINVIRKNNEVELIEK